MNDKRNIKNCIVKAIKHKRPYSLTIDSLRIIEKGETFIQPREGYEFLEIVLTIENESAPDLFINSASQFIAYVDRFLVNESYLVSPHPRLKGKLSVGKKIKGSLCYEVPTDWKSIEIQIKISSFETSETTILIYYP